MSRQHNTDALLISEENLGNLNLETRMSIKMDFVGQVIELELSPRD